MLSINSKVGLHSDHQEHAWALRTIGQDLADLHPEYLEIEFTGQVYKARGRAQTTQTRSKKNSAGKILSEKPRSDAQRESSWFERSYPLYEIHRLDDQGLIQRNNHPNAPDIYILGERLRTVGKMIEAKSGQLLKLTLDNYSVSFTFRNAQGEIFTEEHSTPTLYRSQQDGNLLRGTGRTRDPWALGAPRNAASGAAPAQSKFRLMPERVSTPQTRRKDGSN